MKTRHLIVDANNLLCRAYYVNNLTDKQGNRVSGTFGTMRMMGALLKKFQPVSLTVAWDDGKSKERIAIYPEYKAQRDAKRDPVDKEALHKNRLSCQELFSYLPVKQVMVKDTEADDVIGYLCDRLKGRKVIVSNDQDFVQLVREDVHLYMPNKEIMLTHKNVDGHIGYPVKYYTLWKSMVGDTSDNIKGINGIGPVKATKIIQSRINGGKKLKITPDEQAILDRNKYLIAIGALLTDQQTKGIRLKYKSERNKKSVNFKLVRQKFAKMDFKSLFFQFEGWAHPFKKLIRKPV